MSDDVRPDGPADDDDEADLGPPIAELRRLEQPSSATFLEVLRRKVERRVVTGQVTSAWWYLPRLVLLQFLEMIFGLFEPTDGDKGEDR